LETNDQLSEFRQLSGGMLTGMGLPLDDSGEGEEKSAELGLVFNREAIEPRQQVVNVEDVHKSVFKFCGDPKGREREVADTGQTGLQLCESVSQFFILPDKFVVGQRFFSEVVGHRKIGLASV
jgi:hypothetical protein